MFKTLINFIKIKIQEYKKKRKFKKRIQELKKRDPFTYSH